MLVVQPGPGRPLALTFRSGKQRWSLARLMTAAGYPIMIRYALSGSSQLTCLEILARQP